VAGRIIKKNPTQQFQSETKQVMASKQFTQRMAQLRTSVENTGVAKPGTTASGSKA